MQHGTKTPKRISRTECCCDLNEPVDSIEQCATASSAGRICSIRWRPFFYQSSKAVSLAAVILRPRSINAAFYDSIDNLAAKYSENQLISMKGIELPEAESIHRMIHVPVGGSSLSGLVSGERGLLQTAPEVDLECCKPEAWPAGWQQPE